MARMKVKERRKKKGGSLRVQKRTDIKGFDNLKKKFKFEY